MSRADAERILRAAITAADPAPLVTRALAAMSVTDAESPIHIVAIGKAAATMAVAAVRALDGDVVGSRVAGNRMAGGLIIVPDDTAAADVPAPLELLRASHPIPDVASLAAGHLIAELLEARVAGDVVLVLLSGGASALAVLPAAGVSLDDYADRVRRMMHDGADIRTINTLRRSIDTLKAGGMARLAAPAHVIGLVLSDVIGDPLDIIASGPLTPDYETAANVDLTVIGNNDVARKGASMCARELGYDVIMIDQPVVGEARVAGAEFARIAIRRQPEMNADARPVCMIAGGETTVTVRGPGRGGRNQEFVLGALVELDGTPGITIGSIGTDGIDGASPAAGAIIDADTVARSAAESALQANDAFPLLHAAAATIMTGATGTNVLDVHVAIVNPPPA